MNWDFIVALVSGLFAGGSACAMPLYPAMLNSITQNKENPRLSAIFFTLGLTGVYFLIYLLFGTLTAFLGIDFLEKAENMRGYLTIVGAFFAWFMAWRTIRGNTSGRIIKIINADIGGGYLGALASGFVYGTIITPCNASFLVTGIIPALSSKGTVFDGMMLLLAFSIAMGLPVLFLGWASGTALSAFEFFRRNSRKVELISAVFLILVGFYFMYLFLLRLQYG
jgi:cytochrome c-type biogenesis protein